MPARTPKPAPSRTRSAGPGFLLALLLAASPLHAAEHLTADQVKAAIAKGTPDLAGKDLTGDDLSGLDLHGANLAGADLDRVKLLHTNLVKANLTNANLTGTWIMNANFDGAILHGVTLQVVITSDGMDNERRTAASFVGADLSDTSATVHFSFDDMHGANFTGTQMSVVLANQSMGMLRSEFVNANLEGANFQDAKLGRITFEFANLKGANFKNADLTRADFDGADLTGADFTGAKLDKATFASATTTGAKGLPAPSTQ